ncbi:MAG: C4-type zinc ribbon domain-containing protein [Sediminibacterium sp.]|nr:C4-type zinc ribbon domain-containing protein [Sediminibacterium sp.]
MDKKRSFSIEEKLISLARIQLFDSKIDRIHVLRGELPKEVRDLEDEISGLKTRQIKIEEEINGITTYINEKQEDIKTAKTLIEKYEKQSDNVKNNREYEAITKEIEMQQLEIKLCEKNIRDANEDLAEAVKNLDVTRKKISSLEAIYKVKVDELKVILTQTEKEEKALIKNLTNAHSNIEEKLLEEYTRIRKKFKNGLAVVKVERDACAGCFNAVPPQRQSEIRLHKRIISCENCGRILIDESVEMQAANSEN